MRNSVNIVADELILKEMQAQIATEYVLWSDTEPMGNTLNPLDDPLGGISIDGVCHVATVVFETATSAVLFAEALVRLLIQHGKLVDLRETRSNKHLMTVGQDTKPEEIVDAISNDPDTPA